MGYTHLAMTHHHSIISLSSDGGDASALALGRCLVDAHLRGLWLNDVASEDQVKRLASGDYNFPGWRDLLAAISPRYPDGLFVHADKNYGKMCGFNHGGPEQVMWLIDAEGTISPNYPEDLITSNMRLSTGTLATHGIIVCLVLDRREAAAEIRAHYVKQFSQQSDDLPATAPREAEPAIHESA
ncbi:MAG TPA: hypothetical protein VK638_30345 [Edaphobacter sp.]|nr:hypothetical protein [Edaphobacter sp.]